MKRTSQSQEIPCMQNGMQRSILIQNLGFWETLLCYNQLLPLPPAWVATFRRGVAQPGRAPGSGPGGRRFKSSLPDQSFQQLPLNFWLSVYSGVDDFVTVRFFRAIKLVLQA